MNQSQAMLQHAVALHQSGRLAEARAMYERILSVQPGHPDALHLLGVVFFQEGNSRKAVELIEHAIRLSPNNPAQYQNIGLALSRLGRPEAALASYDKAISLKPDYADAYNNRAATLQELGRLDEALSNYDKALAVNPGFAEAWNNRGAVLRDLNRLEEALDSYDKALSLTPGSAAIWNNRGVVLHDLRRLYDALADQSKAISLRPDYAEAYSNRGATLHNLTRLDEALADLDRAIALKPDHADAYVSRAFVLRDLKRLDEALDNYTKALSLRPAYPFLLGIYLQAKMTACDWHSFDEHLRQYESAIRERKPVTTPFPALALTDDPELHKLAAETYSKAKWPANPILGRFAMPTPGAKLRIGYYSAEFRNYATSYLMVELFEKHDTERFELYAFSFGPDTKDEMRARISAAFGNFMDVREKSDREIAELSRALGIDVAIDLMGHTQHSRPGIFALGCAPIQVNYLGYPGTMGAGYMDYIVADKIVMPSEIRPHYTEKVVRLPYSYQPNDSKRRISGRVFTRQELALPEHGFVFCCFNNSYKILPETFDVWIRMLKAVEGSVLWLLEDNPVAVRNLRKQAAARRIDAGRLIFAERMRPDEHLARHRMADLFLDTWPYNAHTTASDALWTGLPLLTFMGRSFASRVAASLLTVLELPELIARTKEDYEAMGIALALDPARMERIRERIAHARASTPLFDGAIYARHLEAAYETIHARYRSGQAPEDIEIPPQSLQS